MSNEIAAWRCKHECERNNLKDCIEALNAENAGLNETVRRVQAAARTLETTRCEIYQHYVENSKINAVAVSTLDSEREANALLTADIERKDAEIARLREVLGDLIEQCWSCEKELTEEYYGTHYSGESLPLCNARAALGGNDDRYA
jgi:predicted nuclease with TOPRIM domain